MAIMICDTAETADPLGGSRVFIAEYNSEMLMVSKMFTKEEVGKIFRISSVTVDRLRKAGKIGWRQVGGRVFFSEEDIMAFTASSIREVAHE